MDGFLPAMSGNKKPAPNNEAGFLYKVVYCFTNVKLDLLSVPSTETE
ncbi:MAG: hypothetical protein RL007_2654 [Bacteroidota bacterium]|jgi:hypothetical protein